MTSFEIISFEKLLLCCCFYFISTLRYYAIFKARKFQSLFYKTDTCLQKTTTCIGLQTKSIFSVNIYHTYFSILGVTFAVPFLCYFQKLQFLVEKKIEITFVALYFYLCKLEKYVLDF